MGQVQAQARILGGGTVQRNLFGGEVDDMDNNPVGATLGTLYETLVQTQGGMRNRRMPTSLFGHTTGEGVRAPPQDDPPSRNSPIPATSPPASQHGDNNDEDQDSTDHLCPVCWDTLKEPVITKCGHTFCSECLRLSLSRRAECPLDRTKLSRENDFTPNKLVDNIVRNTTGGRTVSRRVLYDGDILELDPPAYLVCENHMGLLSNPHVDHATGQTVCMKCVTDGSSRRLFKNTLVQKKVNALPAHCLNGWKKMPNGDMFYAPSGDEAGRVCTERFTVGEAGDHAKSCPMAMVSCPHNDSCGTMLRSELKTHFENECQHIKCPHAQCSFSGPIAEWRKHMTDYAYEHALEAARAEVRNQQNRTTAQRRVNTAPTGIQETIAVASNTLDAFVRQAGAMLNRPEVMGCVVCWFVMITITAVMFVYFMYIWICRVPDVSLASGVEMEAAMNRIEKLEKMLADYGQNGSPETPQVQNSYMTLGVPESSSGGDGTLSSLFWDMYHIIALPFLPFTLMYRGMQVALRSCCGCFLIMGMLMSTMALAFTILTATGTRF